MQATSSALDHLLRAIGDPVVELLDIGPGHPEFHRAQTLRAAAGVLAKSPDTLSSIVQAIQTTGTGTLSPATRAHFAAAGAWVAGDPVLAARSYASILDAWPRDLLALRLAQSCYFFLGWHGRFFPLVDAIVPAWTLDQRGFEFVMAMAAFAHAENGDAQFAEVLGRKALAIDPACPMGVHAVTHAIAESQRPLQGAQWMRDQHAHWAGQSRMRTHNAWHLAMFDAENGDLASALHILDAWLLPASTRSPLNACDATALLWRLASAGADDEDHWRKVSDAFEASLTPGFWPYVDLHGALAHLAAGQLARAQRLAQAIERCAQGSDYAGPCVHAKSRGRPWGRCRRGPKDATTKLPG